MTLASIAIPTVSKQAVNRPKGTPRAAQTAVSPMDNFAGIPLTREYRPRTPDHCRMIIAGDRKGGKSTFVCSHPSAIVLDFEGGCHAVQHKNAYVVSLDTTPHEDETPNETQWRMLPSWQRFKKVAEMLIADAKTGTPRFTTIAIDTVDEMVETYMRMWCKQNNIDSPGDYKDGRAGWYELRDGVMRELEALASAGYGLILSMHLRQKTIRRGESEVMIPVFWLFDSLRRSVMKIVDQILYIETTTTVQRTMVSAVVGGRQLQVPKEEQTVVARLRSVPLGPGTEVGCRVAIPDQLELPIKDAWSQVYVPAYEAEVTRVKSEQPAT